MRDWSEFLFFAIFLALYLGFIGVPLIGIARKMGYPGPVGLLAAIPGVNVLLAWFMALREWPIERELRRLRTGSAS